MSYKLNYTTEEKIKLAKDNSIDQIYESKKNQRAVRVITVFAYLFSVSLAAIILSLYFTIIWKPSSKDPIATSRIPITICEKIVVPEVTAENIAIKLSNGSDLSLETYFEALKKYLNEEKALLSALRSIRPSRTEFNDHLSRVPSPMMLRARKGTKKWNRARNKNFDDEDDIEESGDKELAVTTPFPTSEPDQNNETTIVFDQEID